MIPSLDIIIVNWNAGDMLAECVGSITGALDASFSLERVVVVDNASTDGSIDAVNMPALPVRIVQNASNEGYARASNQGAEGSRADFLLFLNPDTRLFVDSLSLPIGFMTRRENSSTGILGVQIVDEKNRISRDCARFPTPTSLICSSLGLARLFPAVFPDYFMKEWDHQDSRFVDHVMGSFYLVRREVFEALHGFDESYFVYYEDLDFSFRAHRAGWKSFFLASAKIYHKGGGTSAHVKARRLCYVVRSRLLFSEKHFSAASNLLVTAVAFGIEPWLRIGNALLRGSWRDIGEIVRGYSLILKKS